MKDIIVITADLDAARIMEMVLKRSNEIGIRRITFDVENSHLRDSGMVRDAAEYIRLRNIKRDYLKTILLWDYHGSGNIEKHKPEDYRKKVQKQLDFLSYQDCSYCIVAQPEIEEWIWFDQDSVSNYYGLSLNELGLMVNAFCKKNVKAKRNQDVKSLAFTTKPKELLGYIHSTIRHCRKPMPYELASIAEKADLQKWRQSKTFGVMMELLVRWFS